MSIKAISVLNTVTDNGGDCIVDKKGNVNITGVPFTIPAVNIQSMKRIPSVVGQYQKQIVTYTVANSYTYDITIEGNNTTTGSPLSQTVSYISDAAATTAEISAAVTLLVNGFSGFSVSATDSGSGVVALAGTAAYPTFTVYENDTNIVVTAVLTVAFATAPAGGRTATGRVVVSDGGIPSSIIIDDGGSGYLSPLDASISTIALTFAGGAGASAAGYAVIFEGSVVGTVLTVAGTGYTNRAGIQVAGTPAALLLKYDNPSTTNASNAYAFASLANLTSGYTYTEWQINYNSFVGAGKPNFAQTTSLSQAVVLVYESATNQATLNNVAWGSLYNLQQGYRCMFLDSGTSNTVIATVATGAIAITAGGTPAFDAVSLCITPNDIIACGGYNIPETAAGFVGVVVAITSATAGFVQKGGYNIAASSTVNTGQVFKVVKRFPLSV